MLSFWQYGGAKVKGIFHMFLTVQHHLNNLSHCESKFAFQLPLQLEHRQNHPSPNRCTCVRLQFIREQCEKAITRQSPSFMKGIKESKVISSYSIPGRSYWFLGPTRHWDLCFSDSHSFSWTCNLYLYLALLEISKLSKPLQQIPCLFTPLKVGSVVCQQKL